MAQEYTSQDLQNFFSDFNTRLRDLEEKQRLLKDRMILVGQSFVMNRDKTFEDIQEIKKQVTIMQEEQKRIKEMLQRIIEQIEQLARREELMILQRQFDLFREK